MDLRRPDLEAFTSLWTALRVTYEGTNISRTVARLLHMYQPEDGVLAYERLLKTLFVLLEDFDGDCLRLLVSMVPAPAGVADDVRDEVFHRATGFVKVNASVVYRRAVTSTPELNEAGSPPATCRKSSRQQENIPPVMTGTLPSIRRHPSGSSNQMQAQVAPRDGEVFRGFPPNEIYSTQSRVQTINTFCGPATYGCFARPRTCVNTSLGQHCQPAAPRRPSSTFRQNVLQSPYVQVRKNASQDLYLKTVDNRYVKVPVNRISSFRPYQNDQLRDSQAVPNPVVKKLQDDRLKSQEETITAKVHSAIPLVGLAKTDRGSKLEVPKNAGSSEPRSYGILSSKLGLGSNVSGLSSNSNRELKIAKDGDGAPNVDIALLESGKSRNEQAEDPAREARERFQEEVRKRQQAIQADIYKMDVVRVEEHSEQEPATTINEATDGLTIREELRQSFGSYLNRAETQESFGEDESIRFAVQEPATCVTVPHSLPTSPSVPQIGTSKEFLSMRTSKEQQVMKLNMMRGDAGSSSGLLEISVPMDRASSSTNDQRTEEEKASKVARRIKPEQPRRPKSQRVAQKVPNRSSGPSIQEPASASGETIAQGEGGIHKIVTESLFGCSGAEPESVSTSSGRAATMADVAAYKRQYYDALLSIQRAKAAVAHASATTRNPSGLDRYYYGYLQQQMMRGSRFPQQQSLQNLRGSPWIGSTEWNASILRHAGRSQLHQTLPSPSLWPPELRSLTRDPRDSSGPLQRSQNTSQQLKPTGTRRKKLEEIVGKLKETESTVHRERLDT